jgi:hypothetical protein
MSAKNGAGKIRKLGARGEIDVSVVLREGVIGTLSIGRWRAQQRLLPEDIGFEREDTTLIREYMSLGKKTLIPPSIQRKLNSIENGARYALRRHSLNTPFGLFVPAAAYPALDLEMKRFEAEWFNQRDLLVSKMRANLREVRQAYGEVAKLVFETCGKEKARKYAKRIVQGIPMPEQVTQSFSFEFQVFNVPQPALFDKAIRNKIVKEEQAKGNIQLDDKINEMNSLIAERYAERKQKQVDDFLTGVNAQVRGMVAEVVTAALGSLENNKQQLIGKTATHLQNMLKRFEMLNILNDKEIAAEMDKLKLELDKKPKDRDNQVITKSLKDLQATATELSLELDYRPSRSRSNLSDGEIHEVEGMELPRARRASASASSLIE